MKIKFFDNKRLLDMQSGKSVPPWVVLSKEIPPQAHKEDLEKIQKITNIIAGASIVAIAQ